MQRVIVTGICGGLGRIVARKLHRQMEIIGIDSRPFTEMPRDVVVNEIDIRRRRSRDIFRKSKADAVVHLGTSYNLRRSGSGTHSWNLEVFSSILQFISEYKIRKLVFLSTAAVYGPHPDNPLFIPEDHPLYGTDRYPQLRDIVEIDMLAQSAFWRNPECSVVILRPVNIVGPVRNPQMKYFALSRPPVVMGFDPMVQLTHVEDVARAVELALQPEVKGIFNIAGDGQMPLSRLLSMLGKKPVPVPAQVLRSALHMAGSFKLSSFLPGQIDYLTYPCMVNTERARCVMKFSPHFSIKQCIETILEQNLWKQ